MVALSACALLAGCGGAYIVGAIVALQSGGGSSAVDTTQPDLVVSNFRTPPTATLVTIGSGDLAGVGISFFEDISYSIINQGNDVAPAGYGVNLFLSPTKEISNLAFKVRSDRVDVTTLVGEFTRVISNNSQNVKATILTSETAAITSGSYFLLAKVEGGTELDSDNNEVLALGQVQVYDPRVNVSDPLPATIRSEAGGSNPAPNFVLETISGPTFAFAADALNAGQQQTNDQRVFQVTIQVSRRGDLLTKDEPMELQLFASTDRALSTDDLPIQAPIPQGSTTPPALNFTFPAKDFKGNAVVRPDFPHFTVLMPHTANFAVGLPQNFFIVGQVISRGSQEDRINNSYDNIRAADTRTRIYGRFLQSGKAVLPDLKVDGDDRTDPDALEFTTTEFQIPTPGSQKIFSFQIADADNINPDESQAIILLQSQDFDPVLDLLSPVGTSIKVSDDSASGRPSFMSVPLSAAGTGNNTFYVVISSLSGTGSGNFNLTIFLRARTDASKPVILPLNLGNTLGLDRAQATRVGSAGFPQDIADGSGFGLVIDNGNPINLSFNQGVGSIKELSQTTGAELASEILRQAGKGIESGLDADGRIFVASSTVGNNSNLRINPGNPDAAAALGFPVGETGLSENAVIFRYVQGQEDLQFVFFLPARGLYKLAIEPNPDTLGQGGVSTALQFFDGISQRAITPIKDSTSPDAAFFTGPNGGSLRLERGFYSFTLSAPASIKGQSFRLRLKSNFNPTIEPQ